MTNEPAFPRDERYLGHNGMSLRDWFAGQALAGWMAIPAANPTPDIAKACYMMANFMLVERDRIHDQ